MLIKCVQDLKGIALCLFFIRPTCCGYRDAEVEKKKRGALRNEENRAVEECFQWRRRSNRVGRGDAGVVPPDLHWAKSTNFGAALTSSVTPTSFDTVHPSVLLHPARERKC